jgi:hypothetical protein
MIERHDRAAGIPEEDFDSLVEESLAEDLGAGEMLRHQTTLLGRTA